MVKKILANLSYLDVNSPINSVCRYPTYKDFNSSRIALPNGDNLDQTRFPFLPVA